MNDEEYQIEDFQCPMKEQELEFIEGFGNILWAIENLIKEIKNEQFIQDTKSTDADPDSACADG